MPIQPFMVEDYERMGELVKKWARKTLPPPESIEQLKQQLDQNNIKHNLSRTDFKTLKVINEPSSVLVIRVPPADVIKQVEEELAKGGVYAIPPFYADIFGKQPNIPQGEKKKVHAERIGDYTINFCA